MTTIEVNLADRPYDIVIESDGLNNLGERVRAVAPARQAMLIVDDSVKDSHGNAAAASVRNAGYDVHIHTVTASEQNKSLETVRGLYDAMLAAGIDRTSPVIAVGGGIVGDTAGFAAASYLRGVPFILVPTTLLAMVDASIGGKTGVNHPLPGGGLGKNLIGAFWQPRHVHIDPQTLTTLDDREFRSGIAECIKHGVIADPDLLAFLEPNAAKILKRDDAILTELIARSVPIKVNIVVRDEREAGERALLNLGHTFAHAIEAMPELGLRHGEAVAIGLVAAAHAAGELELLEDEDRARIAALIEACGLPVRLPREVAADDLLRLMQFDKKARDGVVRLVLPFRLGAARIVEDTPASVTERAWRAVGAK
ncbi:MAG: 3-dehydroquinate synthase [Phycisphaerales bacterium]|nr:MAG: 3-dehydroquinate synthase [Phycisphaerales bacterium]